MQLCTTNCLSVYWHTSSSRDEVNFFHLMYDMGKREKYWVKSVVLQVLQESSRIAWDKWTAWDNGWVVLPCVISWFWWWWLRSWSVSWLCSPCIAVQEFLKPVNILQLRYNYSQCLLTITTTSDDQQTTLMVSLTVNKDSIVDDDDDEGSSVVD